MQLETVGSAGDFRRLCVSVCVYRGNPLSLNSFPLSPGRMHNEFVTKSCLSDEMRY